MCITLALFISKRFFEVEDLLADIAVNKPLVLVSALWSWPLRRSCALAVCLAALELLRASAFLIFGSALQYVGSWSHSPSYWPLTRSAGPQAGCLDSHPVLPRVSFLVNDVVSAALVSDLSGPLFPFFPNVLRIIAIYFVGKIQ